MEKTYHCCKCGNSYASYDRIYFCGREMRKLFPVRGRFSFDLLISTEPVEGAISIKIKKVRFPFHDSWSWTSSKKSSPRAGFYYYTEREVNTFFPDAKEGFIGKLWVKVV